MIKLIIFDYDGVIVDSFANVHAVYKLICKKLGKKCPAKLADFKKVYGHSSHECYNNLGFSEEERIKGNLIFKEEILKKEQKPFEGISEVLKKLHKNYQLALVSSSYKVEVEQRLKELGLSKLFNFIRARQGHVRRFQKSRSIKIVIIHFAIKPNEILLVGDRNVDFIAGSKAGLKNILLVEYGWGYDAKEIPEYQQKALVKSPKDILRAAKKF